MTQQSDAPSTNNDQGTKLFPTLKSRGGRQPKLVKWMREHPDEYQKILMFIERGAWDYQAAEAFGVHQSTFISWMRKGREQTSGPYRQFYEDISAAQARCRILAEMEVRRTDPKFYLTHGPGRHTPDRPGWGQHDIKTIQGNPQYPLQEQRQIVHREEASLDQLKDTLQVMIDLGFIEPKPLVKETEEDVIDGQFIPAFRKQITDGDGNGHGAHD